jgi:multidrug efflux pump subunit AcrA (membrane-fusion protein)
MKMPKYTFLSLKTLLAIFILTGISTAVFAQVDQDELKDLPPVVFINYEGPHTRIDTREEIRQIGVVVGQSISNSERGLAPTLAAMSAESRREYSYRFNAGATNRYFVIHSVSGPEDNKINADIFGLGVDAGVDHIRNLRWIIQGYLQAAYDYNVSDAALLAEYITIYNAVYRGNWDYFLRRYKTPVISNLTRERTGLSIRYDEWPGRTLIVIPLGIGGLSAIDTSTISDSRVIEEMRQQDDQGVPQRQDMVDLKEREADEAERRAQAERDAARQQETQVAQERQQVAQERQDIEQERQQTQEDLSAGRITQQEARRAQEELDRREEKVQQRESELDKQDEAITQRLDDAQRLQEFAEQKTDEAQQDRQGIVTDQLGAIATEDTGGIYGVTIEKLDPATMGRIVRFNPTNGRELRRSPLNVIHSRSVTFIGGRIIAIAGENTGSGAVRLVEINQNSLEMAKQGDDDIKSGSLLWVNGNDLYAITINLTDSKCYLGRFDTNLLLQAKSAVTVHQEASVTIQQGRLLTQREDGSVLILNPADLTEMRQ